MGKHKHKKDKKKSKQHKKKKYQTSSSSEDERRQRKDETSSDSEHEWVEKVDDSSDDEQEIIKHKRKHSSSESDDAITNKKSLHGSTSNDRTTEVTNENSKREEWLSLPTSFSSLSNAGRKHKREEEKRLERERQQYDPRACTRELNPYWKDGGDGLPKFKKPEDFELQRDEKDYNKQNYNRKEVPNWKKKRTNEESSTKHEPNNEKKSVNVESSAQEASLSEKELNVLGAKLVKAEIMGNTKLVNELKEKLEKARNSLKDTPTEDHVLLTHTDSQGHSRPAKSASEYGESSTSYKRKKNVETHSGGQRVRYFPDDDKYSLKQMFENEKYDSIDNQNREFMKMAEKVRKNDDFDDFFTDSIRKKESDDKIDQKNRSRAINETEKICSSLDNCKKCIQSELMSKHLMISMTETTYLALPEYEPLTDGHCFIIPIRHVPCSTQLDENEWSEILDTRKSLVKLYGSKGEDVIFFETAMSLHRYPHMHIECVPLPKEEGDLAPIYFKKAIDESESEWAQNKKLVSLKGRDVRKAIPKGLPYFAVSFGMEEGFAHVIEDERSFPSNFAQEIIGGMLDLHHSKWRKPKKQSFEEQSKRVTEFSKEWKGFEHT